MRALTTTTQPPPNKTHTKKQAVTRHTIEEFSNLGKFLPLVWNDPAVVSARNSLTNPLRMFGGK